MVLKSRELNKDLRRSQDTMRGKVDLGEESLCDKHPDGVVKTD